MDIDIENLPKRHVILTLTPEEIAHLNELDDSGAEGYLEALLSDRKELPEKVIVEEL